MCLIANPLRSRKAAGSGLLALDCQRQKPNQKQFDWERLPDTHPELAVTRQVWDQ